MINQYSQFQSLIKQSVVDVIEITSVDIVEGVSVGLTPSGAEITVAGVSVSVGDKAFVKDGVIEREAPNFPLVTIDV